MAAGYSVQEQRAQIILLVRAFEECDPEGLVIPLRERGQATRRALMVTGLSGDASPSAEAWGLRASEAVFRRADVLFEGLVRSLPAIRRILYLAQLGSSTAPLLVGAALLAGLLTNALGPSRHINLLAFPLLGLLAWNLVVYVATLVLWALRGPMRPDGFVHFLWERLFRWALGRRLHTLTEQRAPAQARIIGKAVTRFGALWHRLAGTLLAARARRVLHVAALAMVAGVVAGMYVRGLAFEYRATWESTWLEPVQMQRLLGVLLGPAAAITGLTLPDVAPLRGPQGSGEAAVWIHLYAVTAVLFVGLPRTALALLEGWRARRLAAKLPLDLDEAYFRRLLAAWRGAACRVDILPYSYTPRPAALANLKAVLADFFGARADVRLRDTLEYGAEAGAFGLPEANADSRQDDGACVVVLFSAAQTPEIEVHGRLLENLTTRLDPRRDRLLVVLDASPYRSRVADAGRLNERREAWRRVARDSGLALVDVDLDAGKATADGAAPVDIVGAMRGAIWPASGESA